MLLMYLQLFKCYSRENFLECFQSLTGAEEGEEPVTYGVTLTGCVYSDLSHKKPNSKYYQRTKKYSRSYLTMIVPESLRR